MWKRRRRLTYWGTAAEIGVIELTRFDGTPIWINPDLVQWIEANPDTRVTLTTGTMVMVREEAAVIAQRVAQYRRALLQERGSAEGALQLLRMPEEQ